MYVPSLKKNLVSVAMLEDRGYDVVFSEVKAFLHHVTNLYKLDVDGCETLMGKADKMLSWDEGELWYRILGHLHHGALKVMQ